MWPPTLGLLQKCPNFFIDRGGPDLGVLAPCFPHWPIPLTDTSEAKFGACIPLGMIPRQVRVIYIERALVSVLSATLDELFIKKIPPGPGNISLKASFIVEACRYYNQGKEWHKPFIDTAVAVERAPDEHFVSRHSR